MSIADCDGVLFEPRGSQKLVVRNPIADWEEEEEEKMWMTTGGGLVAGGGRGRRPPPGRPSHGPVGPRARAPTSAGRLQRVLRQRGRPPVAEIFGTGRFSAVEMLFWTISRKSSPNSWTGVLNLGCA
ncbi:unnamed protein product [Nesidiocoris tenuis]|uniref:Uncharacterized protein n=1 Tax=Nesidiocoris tenuis TaxID=355587 RepID=A0A6H5G242_9HEMI|nr:unnamed protein product [Nesidiocoris tenuis]